MRQRLVLFAAAWAAAALTVSARHALDFKVVVAADHPADAISRDRLAEVFRLEIETWEDGTPVRPIDQVPESPVRAAFTEAVFGHSVSALQSSWSRMDFSGRRAPPPEVGSDEEVLARIDGDAGAVGYVAAGTRLAPSFKVLDLSGLEGYGASALREPRRLAEAPGTGDETVSRHGELHLFLTGSCGPEGEGREAVLENLSPYDALGARIETSIWNDGWLSRSSTRYHTLPAQTEERLGCTRRDDGAEKRYAIVEVSSAAVHPPPHGATPHGHHGPARSAIEIVAAGTCGLGGAGQTRAVINRHPWREVVVSVQVREESGGQLRRSYRKDHRLAPGVSRRLGCDADGELRRTFTVLEAEYR